MDNEPNSEPHAHETAFVDAARAAASGPPAAAPPAAIPSSPPASQPPVAQPSAPAAGRPHGPSASPAAPSGAPAAAAPASAAKSFLKDLAAAEGYDVANFDSDDVLAKAMFAHIKKLDTQYKQAITQASSPAAAQPPQQATPPPVQEDDEEPEWDEEAYFGQQWGTPAIDPALQARFERFVQAGIIVRDERTGEYVAADGDELMAKPVLEAVGNAVEARNSRAREFIQGNPYSQTWKALQEPLNRREEAILARVEAMLSQRNAVETFERQHAGTLFTTGPDGKRAWSDTGLAWKSAVDKFRAAGVTDPKTLLSLAGEFVLPHLASTPKPTIPPLTPAAPATPAAATPAQVSQQRQESFLETAARAAGHQPQSSSYVAAGAGPGSGPVEIEERELENYFASRNGQGVHVGR